MNKEIYIATINHWKDRYEESNKRIKELEEEIKESRTFVGKLVYTLKRLRPKR